MPILTILTILKLLLKTFTIKYAKPRCFHCSLDLTKWFMHTWSQRSKQTKWQYFTGCNLRTHLDSAFDRVTGLLVLVFAARNSAYERNKIWSYLSFPAVGEKLKTTVWTVSRLMLLKNSHSILQYNDECDVMFIFPH